MDPLSMTASIGAVLQLTTSLMTYFNSVKNATADQEKVVIEASNLYGLLINLRNRVAKARTDDGWFTQVRALGQKDGPLDQFKEILEKIVKQTSVSGNRDRVKSALTWKWTKSDVDSSLQQIERLKSLTQLALSGDTFELSQAIHTEVVDARILTQQVQHGVEQLRIHADQDLQTKLSLWLRIPDPSTNYQAALKKRHPGTGAWLLTGQKYQAWKSSRSSIFWLHGNAGCGKTVLSATVLQNVQEEASHQPTTVVSYFFFDFNDAQKQSSSLAVKSLLFQHALHMPNGLQALRELHQTCDNGQRQPRDDEVQSLLFTLMRKVQQSYVVLDALDECCDHDREQERGEILAFVEILGSQQLDVRILVTSRRERDIELSLQPIADQMINIQSAVVDIDIDAYIRGQLCTDTKMKRLQLAVKDEIASDLMSKANGMFRWAYCQLEALRKCRNLPALRTALSRLPDTLDETYTRIFKHIAANDDLSSAIPVLRWLCFSNRPLRLSELVDVLAIEHDSDGHGSFDPGRRVFDPDDIMEICSSFISYHTTTLESTLTDSDIVEETDDEIDEEIATNFSQSSVQESHEDERQGHGDTIEVRLAHFSVKEYLLSDRCLFQSEFQPSMCHRVIGESCLHYLQHLSQERTLSDELVASYSLADYAAQHWWSHVVSVSKVYNTQVTRTTTGLICGLLTREQSLLTWNRLYNIDEPNHIPRLSNSADDLASPLYYAANIGIAEVVEELVRQGADVDTEEEEGFYGTALQVASDHGHEKIVQLLLNAKADVNVPGGLHGSALQAASVNGHEKIVQLLLDAGADVNIKELGNSSALQAASANGHEKTVQLLLNAKADVNIQVGYQSNALQAASANGHEKIVQHLLAAEADVNIQGGYHGNALQAASANGHEKIVQHLLAAEADVNIQGRYYGNALQAASANGHEKIVQLLLDAEVDVNMLGGVYGSALQAASANGHEKIVQLLLAATTDVNIQGGPFGSALQAASDHGHKNIVHLLLNHGAYWGV